LTLEQNLIAPFFHLFFRQKAGIVTAFNERCPGLGPGGPFFNAAMGES
jgi:hypothetical protein